MQMEEHFYQVCKFKHIEINLPFNPQFIQFESVMETFFKKNTMVNCMVVKVGWKAAILGTKVIICWCHCKGFVSQVTIISDAWIISSCLSKGWKWMHNVVLRACVDYCNKPQQHHGWVFSCLWPQATINSCKKWSIFCDTKCFKKWISCTMTPDATSKPPLWHQCTTTSQPI